MKWINTGETTMIIDVDLYVICGGIRRTYKYYFFFVFSSLITRQFSVFLSLSMSLFLLLLSIIHIKKTTHTSHDHHRRSVTPIDSQSVKRKNGQKKKRKRTRKTIGESLSKCTVMVLCGYGSISL
jgi:hypothetical protein